MIEYHPTSVNTSEDSTSLVRRCFQAYSQGMCCMRDASGKETSWLVTLRSWKNWTRQKSMLEDSTKRRFSCRKNVVDFKFPFADGTGKLAGRDQVLRIPTLIQDDPARGEKHHDVLQGESDGFRPTDQQADTVEARDDFWSISVNHHVGPRCLQEGSFPVPLT